MMTAIVEHMPHISPQIIENVARVRNDKLRRGHGIDAWLLYETGEHLPHHRNAIQINPGVRFIDQCQRRLLGHELQQFGLLDLAA